MPGKESGNSVEGARVQTGACSVARRRRPRAHCHIVFCVEWLRGAEVGTHCPLKVCARYSQDQVPPEGDENYTVAPMVLDSILCTALSVWKQLAQFHGRREHAPMGVPVETRYRIMRCISLQRTFFRAVQLELASAFMEQ